MALLVDALPLASSACRSIPTGLNPAAVIGRHVTISPGCLVRSATIEHEVVLGHRCVVMEGSIIETGAILANGTVVPPGRCIPARQVWAGSPARYVRDATYDEQAAAMRLAEEIAATAAEHKAQLLPEPDFSVLKELDALKAALRGV